MAAAKPPFGARATAPMYPDSRARRWHPPFPLHLSRAAALSRFGFFAHPSSPFTRMQASTPQQPRRKDARRCAREHAWVEPRRGRAPLAAHRGQCPPAPFCISPATPRDRRPPLSPSPPASRHARCASRAWLLLHSPLPLPSPPPFRSVRASGGSSSQSSWATPTRARRPWCAIAICASSVGGSSRRRVSRKTGAASAASSSAGTSAKSRAAAPRPLRWPLRARTRGRRRRPRSR